MRVALIPECFIDLNPEHNVKQMVNWLTQLKGQKLDLICFGEAFLQGFGALNANYEHDLKLAFSQDDELFKRLGKACLDAGCGLAFGYIEKDDGVLFSSYMVVGADGQKAHHFRRVSPGWKLGEAFQDKRYQEGSDYSSFDYAGKKITIAICGDLWHDDLLEHFMAVDSDLLLWPVYTNYEIDFWEAGEKMEYAKQVAVLNRPVMMVNSFDDGEDKAYGGAFVFENGKVTQELSMGKRGFLILDV